MHAQGFGVYTSLIPMEHNLGTRLPLLSFLLLAVQKSRNGLAQVHDIIDAMKMHVAQPTLFGV